MDETKITNEELKSILPGFYEKQLFEKIIENGVVMDFERDTEILREGQFIKMIPIVINGLIKVYNRYEDKDLLLYYIQPGESCIMSFAASIQNEPSRVYAITEEPSKVLLIPVEVSSEFVKQFPYYNDLFFKLYNQRYADLIDTINHLLFHKMDQRIINYLKERQILKNQKILKLTHKQIAHELGTAREVISRILKKLENDNKIIQHQTGIEVL